jgi:hypothetical protein
LEPVYFTLGIFNHATRCQHSAWRCIGYLKVDYCTVESVDYSNEVHGDPSEILRSNCETPSKPNIVFPKSGTASYVPNNLRDYHAMLNVVLEGLKEAVNNDDGFKWNFTIDGISLKNDHYLNFKIMFIMGDTLAHDKLVGLIKGPSCKNNLCRYCNCPFEETDNHLFHFKHTRMSVIKKMIRDGKHLEVKKLGYYPLIDNIFFDMKYCDEERGINGCLLLETLHFFY